MTTDAMTVEAHDQVVSTMGYEPGYARISRKGWGWRTRIRTDIPRGMVGEPGFPARDGWRTAPTWGHHGGMTTEAMTVEAHEQVVSTMGYEPGYAWFPQGMVGEPGYA